MITLVAVLKLIVYESKRNLKESWIAVKTFVVLNLLNELHQLFYFNNTFEGFTKAT